MEISFLEILDFLKIVNDDQVSNHLNIFESKIIDQFNFNQETLPSHQSINQICNRLPIYQSICHILPQLVIKVVDTILLQHNRLIIIVIIFF
jgi:hypothetical protein